MDFSSDVSFHCFRALKQGSRVVPRLEPLAALPEAPATWLRPRAGLRPQALGRGAQPAGLPGAGRGLLPHGHAAGKAEPWGGGHDGREAVGLARRLRCGRRQGLLRCAHRGGLESHAEGGGERLRRSLAANTFYIGAPPAGSGRQLPVCPGLRSFPFEVLGGPEELGFMAFIMFYMVLLFPLKIIYFIPKLNDPAGVQQRVAAAQPRSQA